MRGSIVSDRWLALSSETMSHALFEYLGQCLLIGARRLILSWGYVQDERYAAGAGRAGAACVSFAQL